MRRLVPLFVTAGLLVSLAACQAEQRVGEAASTVLLRRVRDVRAAAIASDRDAALTELTALRQDVTDLQADGQLSGPQAARVLEASAEVERQLMSLPAPDRPDADEGVGASPTSQGDEEEAEGEEDARKRAEEAAKKAEEADKKRMEESRKRAEDARRKE